ncbi:MAG: MOSC domain-containing protein [Aestuariivirga sp.]
MAQMTKASFQGTVEELYSKLSREDGFEKPRRESLKLLFSGPEGDCHAGLTRASDVRTIPVYRRDTEIRNVRQMTVISIEEMEDVARAMKLDKIDPTWLGANLLAHGIPDLTLLPPSTRLQFPSGATVVVDMENLPCTQVAKVIARVHPAEGLEFVKAAKNKRGVTVWVEREGEIACGDAITVWLPQQRLYSHV